MAKTRTLVTSEDFGKVLNGRIIQSIDGLKKDSEQVTIYFDDGARVDFYHEEDCCSTGVLEDFGDAVADDFVGAVIHEAYVSSNGGNPPVKDYPSESYTWTFYRILTSNGPLILRWLGESNGYYSEEISVYLLEER